MHIYFESPHLTVSQVSSKHFWDYLQCHFTVSPYEDVTS